MEPQEKKVGPITKPSQTRKESRVRDKIKKREGKRKKDLYNIIA